MKRFLITLISVLVLASTGFGTTRDQLRKKFTAQLKECTTASDSLKLLFDIYDLTPFLYRIDISRQVYDVAGRAGNTEAQLEILRNLAIIYADDDSTMRRIIKAALKFEANDVQRETLTFVRVKDRANVTGNKLVDELDDERVGKLIKKVQESAPDDSQGINDRILNMFTLVRFLRTNAPGALMEEILTELGRAIESLPLVLPDLRREFFIQSATAFITMGFPDKAVAPNQNVIDGIKRQNEVMRAKGRKYYSDDYLLYVGYQRRLHCFPVLDKNEVQRIYNNVLRLAQENPDVAEEMKRNGRAEIDYYVATGNWVKAIPLIKEKVDLPENSPYQRDFARFLYEGAKATHNDALTLEAADRYIHIRDLYLDRRYYERARELQVLAGINSANERARSLEQEKIENESRYRHGWTIALSIALPVLIIMIIALAWTYHRSIKLRRSLEDSYNKIRAERDKVEEAKNEMTAARNRALVASRKKTDFINNMTHEVRTPLNAIADYSRLIADCVDDSHSPYLAHYVKLIELNNELVETMVNDVLDISEIDNKKMKVNTQPVNINPMCELALENARHYLHPGVEMVFEHPGIDDLTVKTDRRRVEQVLINLLSNAAKFTKKGKITLSYKVDGKNLVFSVTDTGSGIPKGKEEIIFERFEKLDNSTQGAGLGLPIARLVAGLLRGTVKLDSSYRDGARFVFTLPMQ